MTLHIFNPEHDIALASGLSNFTAPHAGRQLRHDLGFLPALWAAPGDVVMVDDTEQAERQWRRLVNRLNVLQTGHCLTAATPRFMGSGRAVRPADGLREVVGVDPWGWNSALRALLLRRGVKEDVLPSPTGLDAIRQLSHRRVGASLLPRLRIEGTVGEQVECYTVEQVVALQQRYGHLVLKAPWSSSGRGLRFVNPQHAAGDEPFLAGWLRNLLLVQGSVMAEPYYNKVKDFGMEFYSDGDGHVSYLGLSLFHTANGAYTGNVLATEAAKRERLSRYLSPHLTDAVRQLICRETAQVYKGLYRGPFGVDMMVVADHSQFLLHPCVEINLRRTMGHVALALTPATGDQQCVMRITYSDNNYKLTITRR